MHSARKLITLLVLLVTAGLVLASCGGDEEPAATTQAQESTEAATTADQATATTEVEISDFKYAPEAISVSAGDQVTWTNSDEAPHTATADDEAYDTGTLKLDDEGRVTFEEPGSYPYYCRFHAFMRGTVEVE